MSDYDIDAQATELAARLERAGLVTRWATERIAEALQAAHDAGYGEGLAAGHRRNVSDPFAFAAGRVVGQMQATIAATQAPPSFISDAPKAQLVTPGERARWFAANGWMAADDVIRRDIDRGLVPLAAPE